MEYTTTLHDVITSTTIQSVLTDEMYETHQRLQKSKKYGIYFVEQLIKYLIKYPITELHRVPELLSNQRIHVTFTELSEGRKSISSQIYGDRRLPFHPFDLDHNGNHESSNVKARHIQSDFGFKYVSSYDIDHASYLLTKVLLRGNPSNARQHLQTREVESVHQEFEPLQMLSCLEPKDFAVLYLNTSGYSSSATFRFHPELFDIDLLYHPIVTETLLGDIALGNKTHENLFSRLFQVLLLISYDISLLHEEYFSSNDDSDSSPSRPPHVLEFILDCLPASITETDAPLHQKIREQTLCLKDLFTLNEDDIVSPKPITGLIFAIPTHAQLTRTALRKVILACGIAIFDLIKSLPSEIDTLFDNQKHFENQQ
jgi:hypothetical protein